ncbi:protein rep [Janthinobacterium sp. SUN120]|uniref:protein rep n=1 Tax=Janthinobacterium sp. SUN120 TaxID=3004099 RepID=UPI0025B15D85|nr:protein rep [Janthinobacterium sp. SUN120]MDN2716860.1 protein rep [Janthinobacterium sp. SUN120]
MSHIKQVLSIIPSLRREGSKFESAELQNIVREILPDSRVAACLRHRLSNSSVTVSTTERGNTRLGGLMVCDSSHICPVCHSRKMAKEQQIVSRIVHDHYQAGGILLAAALTAPHQVYEPLSENLDQMESIWKCFRSPAIWKRFADKLGIVGCVRRLEVTLGANGWHPHLHVMFLCKSEQAKEITGHSWRTALDDAFHIVSTHWRQAGGKAGIIINENAQAAVAIIEHIDAQRTVNYNTKNMGCCKKPNSLTPIDLLRVVAQSDNGSVTYAAKQLFKEYATAVKGKHTLTYSGSAKLSRNDAVKSADAASTDVVEDKLGTISPDAWSAIIRAGLRGYLAVVKSRRELVAIVLRAALRSGHRHIPLRWMRLAFTAKTKTVIRSSAISPAPDTMVTLCM